jgi:diguanylate cyclase (GGDEF)-like protein
MVGLNRDYQKDHNLGWEKPESLQEEAREKDEKNLNRDEPRRPTNIEVVDEAEKIYQKQQRWLKHIEELIAKFSRSQRNLSKFRKEIKALRLFAEKIQTDALTGAGNRCYYDNFKKQDFDGEKDLNKLAIIVIDLDNFKKINDKFGHAAGDIVLQETVVFFQNHFRSTDLMNVVRIGGDEFLIICRDNRGDNSSDDHFIQGLQAKMTELQNENKKPINFSFGIAVYNAKDNKNLDNTLDRADERMYEDKEKRKFRIKQMFIGQKHNLAPRRQQTNQS